MSSVERYSDKNGKIHQEVSLKNHKIASFSNQLYSWFLQYTESMRMTIICSKKKTNFSMNFDNTDILTIDISNYYKR